MTALEDARKAAAEATAARTPTPRTTPKNNKPSTISEAVEAVDNAPAEVSTTDVVRDAIARQGQGFRAVMPTDMDADRFSRILVTAIKSTPKLLEVMNTDEGQMSLLLAAMQSAMIGLVPNTPTQDAWLIPRKDKGIMKAHLEIGYRGYVKLARRSGVVSDVTAQAVRQGDHFEYEYGLNEKLSHKPGKDRGELTHAWALVRFTNGGHAFTVLDDADVMARRELSPNHSEYGPWATHPAAMWAKSAVRALAPFLELTAEDSQAVETDGQVLTVDNLPEIGAGE